MTNLPKKLKDTFDNYQFVELMDKINETIDYLQAKEEASKGECKEFWEVPYHSDHLFRGDHHNLPSGNCQKWGKSWFEYNKQAEEFLKTNKEYIEQSKEIDPPEHEESWEREIREDNWDTQQGIMTKQTILRRGKRIGNSTTMLKVEMIIDYIRDNFVSKEKIKEEATLIGWPTCECGKSAGITERAIRQLLTSLGL